jgi:proteasome lid subunit RPN8/RPN11
MQISRELLEEIVTHAREDAPNECCGVVAARDGRITGVHRVANTFASPLRFELDPVEQYRATEQIEARGEQMIGSYHSHTKSEAYPSQTDVNQWDPWPELVHLICSIAGEQPVVRAFRVEDKRVEEIELEIDSP